MGTVTAKRASEQVLTFELPPILIGKSCA